MIKKGKLSSSTIAIGPWRVQNSWKSLFVLVTVLVLATTTLMLDQVFQAARVHSVQLLKGLPISTSSSRPKRIVEDIYRVGTPNSYLRSDLDPHISDGFSNLEPHSSGLRIVRDIVAFPEEVMLLVDAVSSSTAPRKDDLLCFFGNLHKTVVFTVEWKDDRHSVLAVRCEHPPPEALLEINREATLLVKGTDFPLPSIARYRTNSSWTPLVYETVTDPDSVILFVKGMLDSNGKPDNYSRSLDKLHCRFGDQVTSRVKVIAQEVVRCELPPQGAMEELNGARVSLFIPKMGLLRSVAYFSTPPPAPPPRSAGRPERQFHICSCTMMWNQAQFLREWIMYHGFLGIERWYLYDNNSDDGIEDVLAGLQPDYNVSRHPWPWIKTQEAGFSHCALRARADCEWVLFADVDEFVYPVRDLLELVFGSPSSTSLAASSSFESQTEKLADKKALPKSWAKWPKSLSGQEVAAKATNGTSVLRKLIQRTLKRGATIGKNVGEVRLVCHNFGPSGLSKAPEDGVVAGYTCRMRWPKRHKSFLYLDAMSDSLLNLVHHFDLKKEYKEMAIHARIAVINHYKFQAWEVFKAKFVRRVATYVVDWREQTANSNDRAPGLGLEAVEPKDWPSRYCEEVDLGLKNFTEKVLRHPQTNLMPWQ
ncbi:unnamed protein product [Calypogeia fissa]